QRPGNWRLGGDDRGRRARVQQHESAAAGGRNRNGVEVAFADTILRHGGDMQSIYRLLERFDGQGGRAQIENRGQVSRRERLWRQEAGDTELFEDGREVDDDGVLELQMTTVFESQVHVPGHAHGCFAARRTASGSLFRLGRDAG